MGHTDSLIIGDAGLPIQEPTDRVGLVIFSVKISIINPRFLSIFNLLNVLRQTSINAIVAAGMTFVILTGGIDLSVGAVSSAMIATGLPLF